MDPPNYSANVPSLDDQIWLSQEYPSYTFMEGMMSLGNNSIASMFPSYNDFVGFKLNREDLLDFSDVEINDIIWENSSAIPFIVVGLIYLLAIFIGGIVWCCCKLCCASKKKPKKTKPKKTKAKNTIEVPGQQPQYEQQPQIGQQPQNGQQPQPNGLRAQLGKLRAQIGKPKPQGPDSQQGQQERQNSLLGQNIQFGLRAKIGKPKQEGQYGESQFGGSQYGGSQFGGSQYGGTQYGQQAGQYGDNEGHGPYGQQEQPKQYEPEGQQHSQLRAPLYSERDDNSRQWGPGKIICYVLMGCWLILFLVLLISSFGMNVEINNSIDDLPGDIDNTLTDAETYLKTTRDQFTAVFVTSYCNLTEIANTIIDQSVYNDYEIYSGTEAFKIQHELTPIKQALTLGSLTILNSVKLLPANKAEARLLSAHLKELHSVKTQMERLEETILKADEFSSASAYLKKIGRSGKFINPRVISYQADDIIQQKLGEVGNELKGHNLKFSDAIDDIELTEIRDQIGDIEEGMDTAKPYLYNTMWVVLSILVVILLLIVFGTVITGLSNAKDLEWCSRMSPATFFNCGMIGIFISGFLLMILCLALYVLSGFFQIACQGIRDLERTDNKPAPICTEDHVLPFYEDIVESCKLGESAYKTLHLCQVYDIEEIKELPDQFRALIPRSRSLAKDVDEKLSFEHLESTLSTMKNSMKGVSQDLEELLRLSNSFLEKVDDKTTPGVKYADMFILSFEKKVKNIEKRISTIEKNLVVLADIQNSDKNRQVPDPTEMLDRVVDQVAAYSDFVYNTTEKKIGQCQPMYNALDVTIEVFCYKVAFPILGFWMSLTWLLLLYIPIMITVETLRKIG